MTERVMGTSSRLQQQDQYKEEEVDYKPLSSVSSSSSRFYTNQNSTSMEEATPSPSSSSSGLLKLWKGSREKRERGGSSSSSTPTSAGGGGGGAQGSPKPLVKAFDRLKSGAQNLKSYWKNDSGRRPVTKQPSLRHSPSIKVYSEIVQEPGKFCVDRRKERID